MKHILPICQKVKLFGNVLCGPYFLLVFLYTVILSQYTGQLFSTSTLNCAYNLSYQEYVDVCTVMFKI